MCKYFLTEQLLAATEHLLMYYVCPCGTERWDSLLDLSKYFLKEKIVTPVR